MQSGGRCVGGEAIGGSARPCGERGRRRGEKGFGKGAWEKMAWKKGLKKGAWKQKGLERNGRKGSCCLTMEISADWQFVLNNKRWKRIEKKTKGL